MVSVKSLDVYGSVDGLQGVLSKSTYTYKDDRGSVVVETSLSSGLLEAGGVVSDPARIASSLKSEKKRRGEGTYASKFYECKTEILLND